MYTEALWSKSATRICPLPRGGTELMSQRRLAEHLTCATSAVHNLVFGTDWVAQSAATEPKRMCSEWQSSSITAYPWRRRGLRGGHSSTRVNVMCGGVGALDERSPFQRGTTAPFRLTAMAPANDKGEQDALHGSFDGGGGVFYHDCVELDLATTKIQDAVLCV